MALHIDVENKDLKIIFLGTGNFATSRKCTSFVIDQQILFDVGYGTVNALIDNNLDTKDIRYLLISHFHGDHIGDIIHFITRRIAKKETHLPLQIIAPKGAKKIIGKYLEAHFADDRADIAKLVPLYESTIANILEINEGQEFNDSIVKIRPFYVQHSPEAQGYIINIKNKIIGCSGDTELCDALLTQIKNADTWVINCSHKDGDNKRNMSASEVAKIARENPGRKFYGVHRKDYVLDTKPANFFLPNDNESTTI